MLVTHEGISQGASGTQHPSLLCPTTVPMNIQQEESRPIQEWVQILQMLLEQREPLAPTGMVSDWEMLVHA